MVIGKIVVYRFNSEDKIFESDINDLSVLNGGLFTSIGTKFYANLPLERGRIYTISITGIEGQDDITIPASFQDYSFSAGASDYVDSEGVHHSGIVTLTNRLRFELII